MSSSTTGLTRLNLSLSFKGHPIRFVGTDENPEWVGADVCNVLEIRNSRDALAGVPEDEKGVAIADTLGGKQQLVTVFEPGLYRLIVKSRKPQAKEFQRWVFREVLPSIRKFGTYPAPNQPISTSSVGSTDDPILCNLRQVEIAIRATAEMREKQLEFERAHLKMVQQLWDTHQLAQSASATATAALHQSTANHGYFTVLGYSRLRSREMPIAQASAHGRKLTAMCVQRGVTVGRMTDPRFGEVNTYPESMLAEYFGDCIDN